jgi:IS30 family transposase
LERRDLIAYLVRQHKKRKRRGYSRKHKKTHIPNRKPISQRPEAATKRERIGDWEADSIVSRKSLAAINVLVDRKSRFTIGLVRRSLSKGTDLGMVSNEDIERIELWLNQRPRKCLGYKEPIEVLIDELNKICDYRSNVALTG